VFQGGINTASTSAFRALSTLLVRTLISTNFCEFQFV